MSDRKREVQSARAFSIAGARGTRYGMLEDGLAERMVRWLDAQDVAEGQAIKPGRVYRVDDLVIKFFEFAGGVRAHLRPSAAVRSARRHAQYLSIGTPRPIATLGRARGRSLLVMERIEGRFLDEALADGDEQALGAFPAFMAGMHARGVFHGDLHILQMIWDGERWYLLDLDGIRHPLRRFRAGRLAEAQWIRIHYSLEGHERVEGVFRSYHQLAGRAGVPVADSDPDRAWGRIEEGRRRFHEAREKLDA